MSLISDALKKARAEAARQDSLRQGMPYAIGVADAPVRRAPWISLLAGLGAGCILAAGVFALAFFAGWGPFRKPAVETRTAAVAETSVTQPPAAAPAAPAMAPATLPAAPIEERQAAAPPTQSPPQFPLNTPIEAPRQPLPPPADIAPPIARDPSPETAPAVPAQAPAPAPVAPAQPAPSAPEASSGGLIEGNTYSGEVPVPGGGSVKLNGIVFSPDHPIAVLDGRVMGPGENVQGFTVVAIESGRIKLQGYGATVYLSPK
jgi:hypothetical protein